MHVLGVNPVRLVRKTTVRRSGISALIASTNTCYESPDKGGAAGIVSGRMIKKIAIAECRRVNRCATI